MTLKKNCSCKALKINPADNVATSLTDIARGEEADVVFDCISGETGLLDSKKGGGVWSQPR